MKVLFVMGNVYPHDDANSVIVTRLAKEIMRNHKDISVVLLGTGAIDSTGNGIVVNGIRIYKLNTRSLDTYSPRLQKLLMSINQPSRKQMLKVLLRHPKLFVEYIQRKLWGGSTSSYYVDGIQRVCKMEDIDIIIGVSFPFCTCLSAAKAKQRIPFVYYQLDPYFSHYLQPSRKRSLRQEDFVCRKASHIIFTDLIKADYQKSPLQKYLEKSSILCFPGIMPSCDKIICMPNEVRSDAINLVYVGTLYGDIRSPDFLYRLVYELIKTGKSVKVDVVGPIFGSLCEDAIRYKDLIGTSVKCHGRVSVEEAKQWMQRADILVNIGNTIGNQMPSKIFEYFSTGKPILNLYKIEDCPTLKYTNKYPYCLDVPEYLPIDKKLIEELSKFCDNSIGKKLAFNQIAAIFPEYTTTAVGRCFLEIINTLT